MKMNHRNRLLSYLVVCLLTFPHCGGGADDDDSSDQGGTTLSGTIMEPQGASNANVSAAVVSGGSMKQATAIEYGPMATLITIVVIPQLTLLGTSLNPKFEPQTQEVESDDDGNFKAEVDVEEGDVVIVDSDNGMGRAYVVEGEDAETGEIELGEIDLEDAMVLRGLLAQLTQAGIDIDALLNGEGPEEAVEIDFDVDCFLRAQQERVAQLDDGADGLNGKLALIPILAAAAGLGDDENQGELIEAVFSGELSDEELAELAEVAADQFTGASVAYREAYPFAIEDERVMRGAYANIIAADENEDSEEEDYCEDDTLLPEIVRMGLEADDIEEFHVLFGDRTGLDVVLGILENYSDGEGGYRFDGPAEDCEDCLVWNPEAVAAMLAAFAEDADLTELPDLAVLLRGLPQNVSGDFSYRDLARALMGHYLSLDDPNDFDPEQIGGFWTLQIENGFRLEADAAIRGVNLIEFYNENGAIINGDDFEICLMNVVDECQAMFYQGDIDGDNFNYEEGLEDPEIVCGDGSCDGYEAETCPLDCGGYEGEEGNIVYAAECGDGSCDGLETLTCPDDCVADGAQDGNVDGNNGEQGDDGSGDAPLNSRSQKVTLLDY